MRQFALQARGNGVLGIRCDVEPRAQLRARAAGTALADGGEGCGHRRVHALDLRLVAHGLGQAIFEGGHIDNPGQRIDALAGGVEQHFAVLVAAHVHAGHGGGVDGVGPAAQRLQQLARGATQGIGAHVRMARRRAGHQRYAQLLARQQKRQGMADNASPTDTDIKGLRHGAIVGGP